MSLRTRPFPLIVVEFFFILFALPLATAQVDRGGIVGTVIDQTGALVPGVQVIVTNISTNQVTTVTTDDQGNYAATLLRIGTYSVEAEKSGFQKTLRPGVDVAVNQTARVDLTLKVGSTGQTIEVSGAAPLLQTEAASLGTVAPEVSATVPTRFITPTTFRSTQLPKEPISVVLTLDTRLSTAGSIKLL